MKKKKKLRLKKQAYILLVILVLIIFGLYFGIKFYKEYQYHQTDEYKLIEKGYLLEQAQTIINSVDHEIIENILGLEKNDDIVSLVQEKYFLKKNFNEYLTYYEENEEESLTDVVALVNTHASKKWYEEVYETDTSLNEKMIVNKFYALTKDYAPTDLKTISLDYSYGVEGENSLLPNAFEAFQNLWQAANDAGFYLMVTSSYRNYTDQEEIYNDRKNSLGERKADETAARPGHSEHQTGLVVDMTSKNEPLAEEFSQSKAYEWLKENAHLYGFIERYPEDKTYITGYSPESWHWRYVGNEAAKVIYDEKITYDEYYAYYIEK